jgi:hypothetical protein
MTNQGEILDLLDNLTPGEVTTFLYRYGFGIGAKEQSQRRGTKKRRIICQIKQITVKYANYDKHEEFVAGLQELFRRNLDGFFIKK